jgi:hypothetical protein
LRVWRHRRGRQPRKSLAFVCDQAIPWRPRVGDHVRIRAWLGLECDCPAVPHHTEEVGRTAMVHGERSTWGPPDHPFIVVFDPPVPQIRIGVSRVPLPARHFAADELEPIEPP